MNVSIETRVASVLAAGLLAVTAGAIAQTQSLPDNENPTSTSPTHMRNPGENIAKTQQNDRGLTRAVMLTDKHKKSSKHRGRQTQQIQATGARTPGP
jgi:hypothetical protein